MDGGMEGWGAGVNKGASGGEEAEMCHLRTCLRLSAGVEMRTPVRAGLPLPCTPLGVSRARVSPGPFQPFVTADEKWRLWLHR